MKLYETINAGNWKKGASGCLIYHFVSEHDIPDDHLFAQTETGAALIKAIKVLFPERCYPYSEFTIAENFNDHPDTTVEDVIRVCKLADV